MKRTGIELALIAVITIVYSFGMGFVHTPSGSPLNAELEQSLRRWTDDSLRPTGLEFERLAGVILPFRIGLQANGHLPAWNPYLGSGVPLFNNAFNYLFNPLHSLPLLLWGPVTGSKVAMLLGLLLAGVNMAVLARVMGMGPLATLFAAGLWLASGQIAGKFYAGHFQLGLSLAWPPLVLAALLWTIRSRSPIAPIAFGGAFALLFYAGNVYYALHTLIWSAGLAMWALAFARTSRRMLLSRLAIAAGFAFGFSALLFFPVWQTRAFVSHEAQQFTTNGRLEGHYSLSQALHHLATPWETWREWENAPVPMNAAVDYAYIGPLTLLLALGAGAAAVLGFARAARRVPDDPFIGLQSGSWLVLIALTLLMLIWASGESPLINSLYRRIPLLAEFRFVGRALAFAALGCILLAAAALDHLWRLIGIQLKRGWLLGGCIVAAVGLWSYGLFYSLSSTSGRLALVGSNFNLLNTFDALRWSKLSQVVEAFILLISAALMVGLFLGSRGQHGWRGLIQRLGAALLLGLSLWLLRDPLLANSALFTFETVEAAPDPLYSDLHAADDDPFPAVNLPFSPRAFEGYNTQIRNWGLNEGWEPAALPAADNATGMLPDLPRWALVPAGGADDLARQLTLEFTSRFGYRPRACYSAAACIIDQPSAITLYERYESLPYAFLVSQARLADAPASLMRADTLPIASVEHRMDSVKLRVQVPEDGQNYLLVVQETNFPGWQASVDDQRQPVETIATGYTDGRQQGFMMLPIPSGDHFVTLWFEAPGLTTGLMVFALAVLAAAIQLWQMFRKTVDPSAAGRQIAPASAKSL